MSATITRRATARLRPKNQLTLPEEVARAVEAEVGDRFFVTPDGPGRVVLERIPRSYAGSLPGLWGTDEEANAYIGAMRDEWEERERRQLGE